MIEVKDFDELKEILNTVDKEFKVISSAVISYDPQSFLLIFNKWIHLNVIKLSNFIYRY